MGLGSILNVNYPSPAKVTSSTGSINLTGQLLTVTSTATKTFTAWNQAVRLVTLDISAAAVWCTFDGTTPSSNAGHVLASGSNFTWSVGMANQAKFVATTTTDARIYASPLQN